MSRIAYDPVKNRFAGIIRDHRVLRTVFYNILDLFFLRSWYVRKLIKKYGSTLNEANKWKLLDAGCGFGQYDRFILNEFKSVELKSIDVKQDYLEDCRAYFNDEIKDGRITFAEADLRALKEKNFYDMAICVDVLEHITEDVQVLENIGQALKTGGTFIMHSPSIYSQEDAGGEESFVDEHARTGYSKQSICEKMKQAGLQPVEIGYTYGDRGHLAWQLLIKYPMLWLNKIKLWALPLLAVYYIFTIPVGIILMKLDMQNRNERGTGIYAVAKKP